MIISGSYGAKLCVLAFIKRGSKATCMCARVQILDTSHRLPLHGAEEAQDKAMACAQEYEACQHILPSVQHIPSILHSTPLMP